MYCQKHHVLQWNIHCVCIYMCVCVCIKIGESFFSLNIYSTSLETNTTTWMRRITTYSSRSSSIFFYFFIVHPFCSRLYIDPILHVAVLDVNCNTEHCVFICIEWRSSLLQYVHTPKYLTITRAIHIVYILCKFCLPLNTWLCSISSHSAYIRSEVALKLVAN